MDFPENGDKRVPDLETALRKCGLSDGMTISSHHHLRDGDRVALTALQTAAKIGVKDLRWFPSASFPCHAPVIDLMEQGVVHHIEGSMNGPLGDYCSKGKMRGLGVLRSHGGRWQAIQDGEVHIDIAVIAAPTADAFGDANGSHGPSACGSIGFALADSIYADKVIVVTDNLVPFPCIPWQIQGNNVDYVVEVPSIGDPSKIVSGTTQITRSPDRLRIAEMMARFLKVTGIMRNGFSFQAGAGGIALAFVDYLRRLYAGGRSKGALRARRVDKISCRTAGRRTDGLHSRRTDVRSGCGEVDCQQSPASADVRRSLPTISMAKEILRRWWTRWCSGQQKWTELQWKRGARIRTDGFCTASGVGRIAFTPGARFWRCRPSAIGYRLSSMK